MKKFVFIFMIMAIATTGAFAQVSIGGGLLLDMSFGNGYKYTGNEDITMNVSIRNISFGAYAFFDATYVEASLSFAFGMLNSSVKVKYSGSDTSVSAKLGNIQQLGFTVLGKYPIDMDSITLFPLFGISYNMVLAGQADAGGKIEDAFDLSQSGLLAGAGVDYNINSSLYIRGQAMLQMRFANKMMKDDIKGVGSDISTTFGFGPVIKVGIGYKL
jgi:outer membrane protein W